MTETSVIFRVQFAHQGEVYEIFAQGVAQGGLFGFVEVEEILFGERSQVVVDPTEERLKHEFDGVRRTYIPLHSILRIDEVEKAGPGSIRSNGDADKGAANVRPFPLPVPPEST